MFGRNNFYHFFHKKYTNLGRWFQIKLEQSKNNNFTHRHCFMKKEFRVVKCQWQHFWLAESVCACVSVCKSTHAMSLRATRMVRGGLCIRRGQHQLLLLLSLFFWTATSTCMRVYVCLLLSFVYLLNCQTSTSFQFQTNVKCNRQIVGRKGIETCKHWDAKCRQNSVRGHGSCTIDGNECSNCWEIRD